MVKHFSVSSSSSSRTSPLAGRRGQHFRIGFSDMEPLWSAEDEKYKVCCRSVHVSKATLYIGTVQLVISCMFAMFFAYHYVMTVSGQHIHGGVGGSSWMDQYYSRYLSQLMLAVSLQVLLVLVMIHGVKTERKSLLMPYIVYAAIAVLTGVAGIINDLMYLDKSVAHQGEASRAAKSQFMSHLLGTLVQAWCLSVVWRCYGYLGEKKVARQIREQLNTTANAFHYHPESLVAAANGYAMMQQPPPYADTVMSPSAVPPPVVIGPLFGGGSEKVKPAMTTTTPTAVASAPSSTDAPPPPPSYQQAAAEQEKPNDSQ